MSRDLAWALVSIVAWVSTGLATRGGSIHLPLAGVSAALLLGAVVLERARLVPLLDLRLREVWVGVLGGAALAALTRLGYAAAVAVVPGLAAPVSELYAAMRTAPSLALTVPLLLLIIACEEVVWRGLLVRDARTCVISALGYTVAQAGAPSPLLMAIALGFGLVWGAQRLWRGGMLAVYLTHVVWNLATLVFWPLDRPL